MLNKVKSCVEAEKQSSETFNQFFIKYMSKVQDQNIDLEIRSQIRFGLLQLSQIDAAIEADYRKLVNDQNAKLG